MNINEIRAAINAKASTMNIKPIGPTVAPIEPQEPTPAASQTAKAPTSTKSATVKPKKVTCRTSKAKTVTANSDIEEIIATKLIPGTDYNTIPGCGRKPSLLKAGAEHLAAIFGYRSTSKVINRVQNYEQLFVLYEIQTTILDTDGNIIAEGIGSCNSKEAKYQRSNFASHLNTILKMAKKRSYVDAILSACHASGVFTQDLEELVESYQTVTVKEA